MAMAFSEIAFKSSNEVQLPSVTVVKGPVRVARAGARAPD